MKTLIIYATAHGCTETCATRLKDGLTGEIELMNMKHQKKVLAVDYDTILIGGSIHAGMVQRSVKKFCRTHMKTLLKKKIGLFLCCMDDDKAEEQFNNAFPESLRTHASAKGLFGGAFNFNKMNFLQKAIVKKISGVDESVNKIKGNAIETFITDLTGKI